MSNPPFVIGDGEQQYSCRDSGMIGDSVCERIVREAPAHLNPGGSAQLLANWLVVGDDDWRARVGGWVAGTGCDAWVMRREFADPARYVSVWLSDAGEYRDEVVKRGAPWLDWFTDRRVGGIGMGLITLRREDSDDRSEPDKILDEITGAGEEVSGPEADGVLARRRYLSLTSDRELLDSRLSLDPAVLLEERSLPGHQGWTRVLRMLNRPGGPGASLQLDEWTRALFAGCRGEAPLSLLVDLLAGAHELDRAALTVAVMPSVRVAIGRGLLHPVTDRIPG